METLLKTSESRRSRRKKKQKELKLDEVKLKDGEAQSPSRFLRISKVVIKKESNKKKKRIRKRFMNYLIKGSCGQNVSLSSNYKKDTAEYSKWKENIFEQTIDLSDSESLMGNPKKSVLVVPSFEIQQKNDVVIDLSKDHPNQNEVIDLTDTVNMTGHCFNSEDVLEPTVIDISEDHLEDQASCELEKDEIFVIGTFNKNSNLTKKCETPSFIPVSSGWNNFNNLISCSKKLKRKCLMKQSVLDKIDSKSVNQFRKDLRKAEENLNRIGENIYVNSPVTFPSNGLRPIIIDGSNVAFIRSDCNFSCKRLEICINYFKGKGHRVTAFVPQYRTLSHKSDNPGLLRRLEREGDVILTPSKKIDGKYIVPYDDRFIVQTAVLKGGIIVSRDNYNDLLKENPAWAETIKYRTLAFTWVDDVLMFPKDPLGEYGPSLEEFLRFH